MYSSLKSEILEKITISKSKVSDVIVKWNRNCKNLSKTGPRFSGDEYLWVVYDKIITMAIELFLHKTQDIRKMGYLLAM